MGQLISVSGIDGAGKTTLAHAILGDLTSRGVRAEELEMGPSRVWRWTELLSRRADSAAMDFSGDRVGLALSFERFGFAMDHVRPALEVYDYVILQRFVLDWAATGRSFGAGESELALIKAFEKVMDSPTFMIYLDVPPEIAAARIRARGKSSNLREEESVLKRTARAYDELLDRFPGVLRVNAELPTHRQVELVREALAQREDERAPGR